MILRFPKVLTIIFCNFIFNIKFVGPFYASNKVLELLYTSVYLLDPVWTCNLRANIRQIKCSISNRPSSFIKHFFLLCVHAVAFQVGPGKIINFFSGRYYVTKLSQSYNIGCSGVFSLNYIIQNKVKSSQNFILSNFTYKNSFFCLFLQFLGSYE